jgi:3-oxoacyl-[acyl-carrier-protein] synthase-3
MTREKLQNISSIISGVGSFLPSNVVSNEELSKTIDTSDEWIVSRTGIKQRSILEEDKQTSYMAFRAAEAAIKNAGITADDIGLIIVATTTPDLTFPSTAALVQAQLKVTSGAAFDIQAVCSGFIYALTTADAYIKTRMYKHVLVIGADTMSRILDWNDRKTCVLFGDGAGAVVVSAATKNENPGIIKSKIYSDGSLADILKTDGGTSLNKTAGFVRMEGKEVFKHAVDKMSEVMQEILNDTGHTIKDIDYIIPHQANIRIIDAVAKRMKVDEQKVISTVSMHANTSAASIPLALSDSFDNQKLKKGQLILVAAIGGGITWGASLIRL